MEVQEFKQAIKKHDFVIGDNFWINDWKFEVVNKNINGELFYTDEVVFKWELTRQEFIQVIINNHPEIKNPEEFFDKHKDEIVHCFTKGFDVLVGECGATYGTVINNAVDEVIE